MTNQQKGFVLIGLLLAWGGVSTYQMLDSSESELNDHFVPLRQEKFTLPSINALLLNQSFPNSRQQVKFSLPRNIFAPIGMPKTSAVPQQQKPSTPPNIVASSPAPPPPPGLSPEELAAQRARQQLNEFRFLGYLTRGGESQAFLTNGQAIYIVKQGEMLEGQVQVNRIEPETIVLSTKIWETGNQVQATIPLTPETRS